MPTPLAPIDFQCSRCGALLKVDGSTQNIRCSYCAADMLLPEELWRRFHPPAPAPPPPDPVASAAKTSRTLIVVIVASAVIPAVLGIVAAGVGVFAAVKGTSVSVGPTPLDPTASAGDPCNGRHAACSKDGKADLVCGAAGTMIVAQTCKGPGGCHASADGTSIDCDTTLADVGDPCEVDDDACSTDHRSEIRCQAGHYVVLATCKGADGCTLTPEKSGKGYTLSCDDHVADVGDPCFDAERTACSSDHKAYLTCTAQKFVVARACKRRGCTVKKLVGTGKTEMDCE
jgi:hypothetical protein